jgi:hypothetical protein
MMLIGICINPDMPCVILMKPILLLIGVVTGALGIVAITWNFTRKSKND